MSAPMVFQKKPKQVQAMRYDNTPESAEAIREWVGSEGIVFQVREARPAGGYVCELIAVDGIPAEVAPGWWVVRHESSAFEGYSPRVFQAWYERVIV